MTKYEIGEVYDAIVNCMNKTKLTPQEKIKLLDLAHILAVTVLERATEQHEQLMKEHFKVKQS
jgi:hypothetical protein